MSVDWDVRPVWAPPGPEDGPPRRRRRWWVAALVLVVLVLAAAVAVEWWARGEAEAQVSAGLAEAGVTGDVTVGVGSGAGPSVLRAAAFGHLDLVDVGVRNGLMGGVPVVRADYRLRDLDVDVSPGAGSVAVDRIGGGSVRLVLDPVVVGAAVGVDLRAADGRLRLGSPGVPARTRVEGADVVVEPVEAGTGVAAVTIPAADPYLLPCRPRVSVRGDLLVLACSGRRLPGVLAGPLQAGTRGGGGGSDAPVVVLPSPQTTVRDGG